MSTCQPTCHIVGHLALSAYIVEVSLDNKPDLQMCALFGECVINNAYPEARSATCSCISLVVAL